MLFVDKEDLEDLKDHQVNIYFKVDSKDGVVNQLLTNLDGV